MFIPRPFTALATTWRLSPTEHWAQSSARWLRSLYGAERRDLIHYDTYCRAPFICDQCFWTMDNIIAVMAVKNCVNRRHGIKWKVNKIHFSSASWGTACCPWMRCRTPDVNNSIFLLRQTSRHRKLSLWMFSAVPKVQNISFWLQWITVNIIKNALLPEVPAMETRLLKPHNSIWTYNATSIT